MADVALICVRDDAWKGDLLAVALERYGFTVCRSASVFEDFSGYAGVIVLISPGAARSELVMGTATRAMDWGKLIPAFVSLCPLPDRLVGVALHDLSTWAGAAEDKVVKAIAYHAHRLSGAGGRRELGPDRSLRRLAQEAGPLQLTFEPNDFADQHGGGYHGYQQAYIAPPAPESYDIERGYGRGYGAARQEPYFVAASQNELDYGGYYQTQPVYAQPAPFDIQIAVSPNEADRRRAYFADPRGGHGEFYRGAHERGHDIEWREEEPDGYRQRRSLPGLFALLIGATLLASMAWYGQGRSRAVEASHAPSAIATAALSEPMVIEPTHPPETQLAAR